MQSECLKRSDLIKVVYQFNSSNSMFGLCAFDFWINGEVIVGDPRPQHATIPSSCLYFQLIKIF